MIHYEAAGHGIPLVLLHGIGSNSRSWSRQLAALATDFRVIAWDAPGFGKSEDPKADTPSIRYYADSLRSLFDAAQLKNAIVLGHSLGGLIAQEFYRCYPDRVQSLILADTTQGGARHLEQRLHMIRTLTPAALARERAPHLLSKTAPQELIDEAVEIMAEVRRPGYEFAALAMAQSDLRGVLDDIRIPLLMIWGAEDEITPLWQGWPSRARLEVIPNAGHLCYIEQPERFNSIVRKWAEKETRGS